MCQFPWTGRASICERYEMQVYGEPTESVSSLVGVQELGGFFLHERRERYFLSAERSVTHHSAATTKLEGADRLKSEGNAKLINWQSSRNEGKYVHVYHEEACLEAGFDVGDGQLLTSDWFGVSTVDLRKVKKRAVRPLEGHAPPTITYAPSVHGTRQ